MLIIFVSVVVGFFVLRFLGRRFFNQKYRADVVAAAIVAAFLIGLVWPLSHRGGAPDTSASAVKCSELNLTQADISQLKPLAGGTDIGSLDVTTLGDFKYSLDKFRKGSTIYASGWVGDSATKTPIRGVVLVIDSKTIVNATSSYGVARPDVAKVFGPTMLYVGFLNAPISTAGLAKGRHVIQAAGVTDDAKGYYLVGVPHVITLY
ncbi:MAG TPA: hypothetical protein VMF11_05265 [Candidatus Baltobacteraceae bacterium]|nr:hypothetical protein [Candidatus Baltobacteraceae bacterium]